MSCVVGGVVAFGMGAVYDTHGGQCMEAAYAQCHSEVCNMCAD
jgi:hypothetical protein